MRPRVQKNVINRIVELRKSGMGYRRISKCLEKEDLATLSKSTVANCCDQAQAQIKISARKLRRDPIIRALARTEAKLQKQVNQIQMRREAHQRVRNLQLQRAETIEGLQDIFKDSVELKKFVQETLYDSQVLKEFELYCEANSLPPAKTLSNAVGSLDKYETENEDMWGWPDLPSYIEEQLDIFLISEKQKKRQKQLQKSAPSILNFKCSFCGAAYETMTIHSAGGVILCNCGKRYKVKCTVCKGQFDFDVKEEVFFCKKCNVSFGRPTLTYHDYAFLREPADTSTDTLSKDTPF